LIFDLHAIQQYNVNITDKTRYSPECLVTVSKVSMMKCRNVAIHFLANTNLQHNYTFVTHLIKMSHM